MIQIGKGFALMGLLSIGLFATKGYAASDSCVHQILQFLQANQSPDSSTGFPKGIFPSYRQYAYQPRILKDDDNFFFTGLIVFTLNEIYPNLSKEDQKIADVIKNRAIEAFPLYRNKNGGATYNFWRTHPQKIFPNSGWLNWFNRKQSLPDDFDDTAIGLLAESADTNEVRKVHNYMQSFTNHKGKRIKNTFKSYRNIPAYSVWFGKKFPVDFDVCVAANVLYLVSKYKLPWTSADSATLQFIAKTIETGDIFKHPDYVSPHYHTTPIIIYHLSRLMLVRPDLLSSQKALLIREAQNEFTATQDPMVKIILSTALKRLKVNRVITRSSGDCTDMTTTYARDGFVFFIANIASMLPNPLKSPIGKKGLGKFYYYCPAYNLALVLENYFTDAL